MKSQSLDDLREFYEFVGEKLHNGGAGLSPEEAVNQWRALHPSSEELSQSVAAVRQALADLAGGDQGRPVDEVLTELRRRYQLSDK
jgi:hypothetical protein